MPLNLQCKSTNCNPHIGTMTVEEIIQDRQKFSEAVFKIAYGVCANENMLLYNNTMVHP